jgi:acyl dehydratase
MSATRVTASAAAALAVGTVLHRVALPAVSRTQLVYYCAAARVTDPIHYDREAARAAGFNDVVVNGSLRIAWLTQALADLVAAPDFVSSLRAAHRGPMLAGQSLSLVVRVAAPLIDQGAALWLPCEVIGTIDDQVVDQAEGVLTLLR